MIQKLKIGIDVDDVLLSCVPYALELENRRTGSDLSVNNVTSWGPTGKSTDCIFQYFEDEDFYKTQPMIQGADSFLLSLMSFADVFIITAVDPQFMGARIKRLMEFFPFLKSENIIMSSRKDLFHVDILIDDGAHNICDSSASYPILIRKPWNQHMTGLLSCQNYNECIQLIYAIMMPSKTTVTNPIETIFCFVGPTGSHKNEIASALAKQGYGSMLRTITTDQSKEATHTVVTKKQFLAREDSFIERTVYGGEYYGMDKSCLSSVMNAHKPVFAVLDICGVMALKSRYQNVVSCYIKTNKKTSIQGILEKDIPIEKKSNLLLALDDERKNEKVCDFVIPYVTMEDTLNEIKKLLS